MTAMTAPDKLPFTFFPSYFEAAEQLPDEQRLQLYDVICRYSFTGEPPGNDCDFIVKAVFLGIKPNLDSSKKRRKAGQKGGENASHNRTTITATHNASAPVSSNKDKDKDKDKDKKNTASGDAEQPPEPKYISKKKRELKNSTLQQFEKLWDSFGFKKGKAEAADSFLEISPDKDLFEKIIQGATREANSRQLTIENGGSPKWLQGWLSARRWEDEPYKKPEGSEWNH